MRRCLAYWIGLEELRPQAHATAISIASRNGLIFLAQPSSCFTRFVQSTQCCHEGIFLFKTPVGEWVIHMIAFPDAEDPLLECVAVFGKVFIQKENELFRNSEELRNKLLEYGYKSANQDKIELLCKALGQLLGTEVDYSSEVDRTWVIRIEESNVPMMIQRDQENHYRLLVDTLSFKQMFNA
jgi:hypothetical protein